MKKTIFLVGIVLSGFNTIMAQTAPEIEWQKNYGGTGRDQLNSIQKTSDGGYILAGSSNSTDGDVTVNHGSDDFWVVKQNNAGTIEWQKSYGGSDRDEANAIIQTTDGGYVVVGSSGSNDGDVSRKNDPGVDDFWIVKLDPKGNIQWEKSYGGSWVDIAYSVVQASDGGYVVAGLAISNNGDVTGHHGTANGDVWVIKLNSDGNLQWQKCYGGSLSEEAKSIVKTPDGGYILAGTTWSTDGDVNDNKGNMDAWVIKIDTNGNILWKKSYGGSSQDAASAIQNTLDGGYFVTGATWSSTGAFSQNHGKKDAWAMKLANNGDVQWQKLFGGSDEESFIASQQTPDGGYVIAGSTNSSDGDIAGKHNGNNSGDIWIVKLSKTGNIEWQKTLGGNDHDYCSAMQLASDGRIILVGSIKSIDGDITDHYGKDEEFSFLRDPDTWIVQLSAYGALISQKNKLSKPIRSTLKVFPNSFRDHLSVQSDDTILGVSLSNASGKLVKSAEQINQKEYSLFTQDLPQGIYILTIKTEKEITNQNVIKR